MNAMKDEPKTKIRLAGELQKLRRMVADMKTAEEKALRESEKRYRDLLEKSSDPIFSFTAEGRYTFVNKAFAEGVGMKTGDVIGRTIWDVFPQDEADKRYAALSQVFKTGREKTIEVRVPRPDGDRFYITTITPVKSREGHVDSVICSSKNITERRLMEDMMRENERRYRHLVESSSDIIYTTDWRGLFSYLNPSVERLTGYAVEELLGKHYHFLTRTDYHDELDKFYGKQFAKKTLVTYHELPIINKDGSERWIGQQVQLIFEHKEIVGFQAVARDMTDRRQAEEEHRQREKLSAIVETVGMVCHEMNQPMQAILGHVDLLLMSIPEGDPDMKRLQIIKEQVERMRAFTGKLRKITRHKTKAYAGKMRIIDIDKSVG
jgi:PAS domain S-box-containing protein